MIQLRYRHTLAHLAGHLSRWWVIACLLYFMAVAMRIALFKNLLMLYIMGLPIATLLGVVSLISVSLFLYVWQRGIFHQR